jgi:hypothetical protein
MIVNDGLNIIRDLIVGTGTTINYGGLGTVGTTNPVAVTDTGLNNDVNFGNTDTIQSVTLEAYDKQAIVTYILPATSSTTTTFREIGLNRGTAKLFNRQTFYDFPHTSSEEWHMVTAINIE